MTISNLTRRGALGAFVALTAAPAIAHVPSADRANALWAERQIQVERLAWLSVEYDAAAAKLPEWATSGFDRIDADGNPCGEIRAWPLIEDLTPPPMGERIVRPSIWQAREHFEFSVRVFGFSPEYRNRCRATMRASIRKFVARLRARNQLYDELGLSIIDREMTAACNAMCAAEDEIEVLEALPSVVAARVMAGVCNDCYRSATASGNGYCGTMAIGAVALRGLLPSLPAGLIRDHVALFVDNPELPLSRMPFSPL
jgi:hypothetical protein